ncbi:MAG: thiol reductase thioredoxin [Bacteroidales bacterium]|nr:thiol reductase thioredoxin [Bacteroidales bacterium]
MIINITDQNIDEVLSTNKLVVIDFWSVGCARCTEFVAPILEDIAEEYQNKIIIAKLNIRENLHSYLKYQIKTIPTVLFIKNNEIIKQFTDSITKALLIENIEFFS